MVKVENNTVNIDFPTLFNICNHVLKMSVTCGINFDYLDKCNISIPLKDNRDTPYFDITFDDDIHFVKPT